MLIEGQDRIVSVIGLCRYNYQLVCRFDRMNPLFQVNDQGRMGCVGVCCFPVQRYLRLGWGLG